MIDPLRSAHLLRIAESSDARGEIVRRAARRGDVHRVRRGAYVGADRWAALDEVQRHLTEIHAAVATLRSSAVVSHRSAALMLGLPVVGVRDDRVHLTVVGNSAGGARSAVARHAVERPVPETVVAGHRVTSPARTVVDLARTYGFLTGVAAGDAALHSGLVTLDELRAAVEAAAGGRGVRIARDVVDFVDGRSESAGESLSRVRIHELGLPPPDLQRVITDHHGFVGRVDFWWEDVAVIGEFDGRAKYRIDGGDPDRLWDEKLREDRLRATGARMVRWTWADAWTVTPLAARLVHAGVGAPPSVDRAHRS